ncbi:hypothetical protein BZA70DRAFT_279828 [Myxozyma melibiosi]|uniref:Uncharacterized protein n=1 Tax=Myxozyma melibiosi TaxID=54550 RepID=A0ABR1F4I2_9ASCO
MSSLDRGFPPSAHSHSLAGSKRRVVDDDEYSGEQANKRQFRHGEGGSSSRALQGDGSWGGYNSTSNMPMMAEDSARAARSCSPYIDGDEDAEEKTSPVLVDEEDDSMMMTPDSIDLRQHGASPPPFSLDHISIDDHHHSDISSNLNATAHPTSINNPNPSKPQLICDNPDSLKQSGMKKMVYMGYRADCPKCVARQAGHYSHIVYIPDR